MLSTTDDGFPSEGVGLRFTSRQHEWQPRGGTESDQWQFPDRDRVNRATGEIFPGGAPPGMSQSDLLFGPRSAPAGTQTGDAGALEAGVMGSGFPDTGRPGSERPETVRMEPGTPQLLWQLHNRYILSQIRNGVMIVDQHVAHERILYEQALDRMERGLRASQQLLFPATVELTPGDASLFKELLPYFEQLGFDAKPFGGNTVLIEGVPQDVKPGHEQSILHEMLEQYKEYQQHAPTDVRDNMAKAYSCKSAIKSGDPLSEQEMRSLIDQLFATRMPYVCPHGRPIVLRISTDELDRRFGRK